MFDELYNTFRSLCKSENEIKATAGKKKSKCACEQMHTHSQKLMSNNQIHQNMCYICWKQTIGASLHNNSEK